jgi:hypothetical protein
VATDFETMTWNQLAAICRPLPGVTEGTVPQIATSPLGFRVGNNQQKFFAFVDSKRSSSVSSHYLASASAGRLFIDDIHERSVELG